MNSPRYTVCVAEWALDRTAIASVRERVFVREQHVPVALEWDGLDPRCVQVLATDAQSRPIGTGRLTPQGQIGRMAVLREWRGLGVGRRLLEVLLEAAARAGHGEVVLNAQTQAIPFYEAYGFRVQGEIFLEAGIPHRRMTRLIESRVTGSMDTSRAGN